MVQKGSKARCEKKVRKYEEGTRFTATEVEDIQKAHKHAVKRKQTVTRSDSSDG